MFSGQGLGFCKAPVDNFKCNRVERAINIRTLLISGLLQGEHGNTLVNSGAESANVGVTATVN